METEILTKKKLKRVPKLRFIEFKEDWKYKMLGKECKHISYGLTVRPKFEENGIPLVSAREITSGEVDISKAPKISIDEFHNLSDKAKPKKGDIFLSKTGTIGFTARFMEDYPIAITQNIAVIRIDNTEVNSPLYLMQYFKTEKFYRSAIAKVNQSTIMDLQLGDIRKLQIPFSSIPEQQKIASFLSAVDKKIQQLTHKKELLETYKNGVMQQLFSQGIRFKDKHKKDFPEWEKKKYGDIYTFYSTNSFSREQLNYEKGEVKNIHYGDIHTKLPTLFHLKKENIPYVNSEIDISKIKGENYCQEGDLIIADASEDYKDIGKAIELIELNNEKVLAGLHTFIARPASGKISKGFSGYLMQSWKVRKQIMTIAQGTKVLGLSATRMKNLKMEIPALEEQQKIAGFLSAIDKKIEAVSQQIEKTQNFKKGLLQQMFV